MCVTTPSPWVIVASRLGSPSRCITNPGCVGVEDWVGYWVLGLTPGARGTLRGGREARSLPPRLLHVSLSFLPEQVSFGCSTCGGSDALERAKQSRGGGSLRSVPTGGP